MPTRKAANQKNAVVRDTRAGATFFADYDRFYRHRQQGGLQFEFHGDRREVAEPLKVAYLFIEKRDRRPLAAIPYVSTKDVATAKALLRDVPFVDVAGFLEYALAEAKKTKFEVQTLGGLKQYASAYLNRRSEHAATAARAKARAEQDRQAALLTEYDRYRQQQAEAIFVALPAAEQAIITNLALGKTSTMKNRPGSIAGVIVATAKARITAERHADRVSSFEAWRQRRAA